MRTVLSNDLARLGDLGGTGMVQVAGPTYGALE